jgi:hypothetical protein
VYVFQSEAHDYGVEKRLKNTHHVDSNDQRLLMPKDGNQCAPSNSPIINQNALIPDVDAASNDESQHISILMNEKQNNIAPVDVDAQPADTTSLLDNDDVQVQEAVVEEHDLTERRNSTQLSNDTIQSSTQPSSDTIQVSANMAKSHAVNSSQELEDHDEIPTQEAISDNDPSSNSKTDEESIVPDVHTCDKDKDDISNERAVECVPAVDNSNILETQDETPQLDDDFTILSTSGSSRMDDQQTQANEEIVLSEGYKKPDIELSEGLFKRPNKITLVERMVK